MTRTVSKGSRSQPDQSKLARKFFAKLRGNRTLFASLIGIVSRATTAVSGVAIASLVVGNVGGENYGLMAIAISLSTWYTLVDFGFGVALQNAISRRIARRRPTERLVLAAKVFAIGILVVGTVAVIIGAQFIGRLLPVSEKTKEPALYWIAAAGFSVVTGAALGVLGRVAQALRRGAQFYGLTAAGSIAAWIGIWIASRTHWKSIMTVNILAMQLIPAILLIPLFSLCRSNLQANTLSYLRRAGKIVAYRALKFGAFSGLSMLVLQVDYIIIAQILCSLDAAEYNLAFRVTNIVFSLYVTTLAAYWPAAAEKIAEGEWMQAEGLMARLLRLGLLIGLLVYISLAMFGSHLYRILLPAGETSAIPSTFLLLCLGIYWILRVWTDTYATYLQAADRVKVLICAIPFQAAAAWTFEVVLAKHIGVGGIPLGMALAFAATVAWILPITVKRLGVNPR